MSTLSDKELIIIDHLGNNGDLITQRQIAKHTGFSLGLTNIILKKLGRTGYIKTKQLTPKKMYYILTRKGMTEKAKKSYNYIFKTIKEFKNLKNRSKKLILDEYKKGRRNFGVVGDNEIADILEIAAKDISGIKIEMLNNIQIVSEDKEIDVVIDCRSDHDSSENVKISDKLNTIKLMDYIMGENKIEYSN